MNVNDVYEICLFAINKHQSGYLSPDEFDRVINLGQRSYISYLLGIFQSYVPGRPIARVELGQNSIVRQRLTPAIYQTVLNVDLNGESPYPGDYLQADAMWSLYGYQRIRCIQQDFWYSYYNSSIDPVAELPIYMIKDIGLQFAPESIGKAKLSYVRNPPDIHWGYDEDPNGIPVYNPLTSNQPIWDDLEILEIIIRALDLVGVNLQAPQVLQYSQMIKTQGQ